MPLMSTVVATLRRIEAASFREVDIAWLAAFRALFGIVMCVSALRFIFSGWVDDLFVQPNFHFKYLGFGWVEPLPGPGMHALFWVLAALGLAIAVGFLYRVSSVLFAIGFGYLQLIDVATYLNHYYLAGLLALLLAVSPAPRAHSFDARFGVCRSAERVSALWLYLFRFQIAVVYSFAGFAKAQADWLVHAEPLSIWIGSHTDMPVVGPVLAAPWAPWVASWAGFLFDSSIAWLLSSRRLRPFAFAAVIAFHVFTGMLFPIGMFPVIMVLAALVFFPPDWPRSAANLVRRLVGRPPAGSAPRSDDTGAVGEPRSAGSSSRQRRVGLALVMIYCVLQLVVPLRFLLYRGNVLWHEQGMRFSWRVMVREKNGSVTFVVRDKTSDRIWEVNPRSYLTRIQERETSTQPDLILQLAHRIRSDFEKRGIGPVEVRADVLVSLNGRRLARLIDPDVDLARVSDGIGRAGWILPSPVDVPPRLRPL